MTIPTWHILLIVQEQVRFPYAQALASSSRRYTLFNPQDMLYTATAVFNIAARLLSVKILM